MSDANDNLPEFEEGKLYLLRGTTGAEIKKRIRMNRPCCVSGGGISLVSQTTDGAVIRGVDAGKGGGNSTAGDKLPDFNPKKIYLLRNETISAMFTAARSNHTKVVTGTGLTIPSDGTSGVTVASP